MTSISAASINTYQSPLQKLQDELLSEVNSGAISSSDKDALSAALTDIDSVLQASRASDQASDQASGTRPSPDQLKSKIDDLIAGEVSSGKLTSDQATELQGIFKAAFANGPGGAGGPSGWPRRSALRMARPRATTLRRARLRLTTFSSSSCNRCRISCRLRHRRPTVRPVVRA
ncbi:hypothetical protein ACF1BQ_003230 [Bradyrhizobium sp. RDT10]